jgi:hypothetical protein
VTSHEHSGADGRGRSGYSGLVGTSGALADAPAGTGVKLSKLVVETLRDLPEGQAKAVAGAIGRIAPDAGRPLKIRPPTGADRRRYLAIVPQQPDAPVVIYRKLRPADGEGNGYLVTALINRREYEGYERAEREGVLDTPAGNLLMWLGWP